MNKSILFAFLMVASPVLADVPDDPHLADEWERKAMENLEKKTNLPPDEAIPMLGKILRQISRDYFSGGDRKWRVHKKAQQIALSIPGHAEYFGNKIRRDGELFASGRGHEVQGGPLWDFETLGQLPSPETVKVLGGFLDDERGRIKDRSPDADVARIPANNLLAARALHSLNIVNPPLRKKPGSYDDVHPWQLWFAQVEAGTRTFRFEGDPQEYNLAGPVSEARAPLAGVDSGSERPTLPPASPTAVGGEKSVPVVPLAAAGLLLAVAFWLAIRRKGSAP